MASNGFDPNQARDKDGKWTDEGAEKADKSPKGYDSRRDTTIERAAKSSKKAKRREKLKLVKTPSTRKTVKLSKAEYAMVIREISTNITEDELKMPVVVKGIRNYRYTFEVYGYGHYRIIGRKN